MKFKVGDIVYHYSSRTIQYEVLAIGRRDDITIRKLSRTGKSMTQNPMHTILSRNLTLVKRKNAIIEVW